MKKILIVDYKMNNLFSIYNSIKYLGYDVKVSSNHKSINRSDIIILPGVGSYPVAMQRLKKLNLIEPIKEFAKKEKKIIGICLGMQLLFNYSEEIKKTKGLGLIDGQIKSIKKYRSSMIVPHVGWNNIIIKKKLDSKIMSFNGKNFYFVHSFYPTLKNSKNNIFYTNYNKLLFTSMVIQNNIIACQFHPEKSGSNGLNLLKYFLK